MNQPFPEDLESRILQMLDGELDTRRIQQLDSELQKDKQARELYLQIATLHSALQSHHQARTELSHMPIVSAKRLLAFQQRRIVKISIAAAAVFVFSTALLWMHIASTPPTALARFQVAQDTSYTITHSDSTDLPSGNVMRVGSKLRLTSGMIEAEFSSGARCVIEAPSELKVLAEDRIFLTGGVSWFEVPPKAVGFTIETPKLKIVDLGTEFGVIATLKGMPEVHVIKGAVEIGPRKGKSEGRKIVLKTGQARKLDASGKLQVIPADSKRFSSLVLRPLSIRNPGFDIVDHLDVDQDVRGYGSIANWATNGKGIGTSNISQPFLTQPAHSGTHAAFIQSKGIISQTVSGFDSSKLYTVTYFVSERGFKPNTSTQTSVSLDLGANFYSPPHPIIKTDAFRRIVSGPLAVFGPTANIQISATPLIGDTSLLVDSVSISRAVPAIPDGGFEHPVLGKRDFKQANGTGHGDLTLSSWKFADGGGITTNGSDFHPPFAPEGSQVAILQNETASFQTAVGGFEPGVTYSLSLEAAGRKGEVMPFKVMLDDQILSFENKPTITPLVGEFTTQTSDHFTAQKDTYILNFQAAGIGSSFIDDLRFNFVAEATGLPVEK
ncbi:MAG: FecR family protein [Verrucomicrobiota bacterium]